MDRLSTTGIIVNTTQQEVRISFVFQLFEPSWGIWMLDSTVCVCGRRRNRKKASNKRQLKKNETKATMSDDGEERLQKTPNRHPPRADDSSSVSNGLSLSFTYASYGGLNL